MRMTVRSERGGGRNGLLRPSCAPPLDRHERISTLLCADVTVRFWSRMSVAVSLATVFGQNLDQTILTVSRLSRTANQSVVN